MKKLSDCRVLLVDDAKLNLDILVEGLKADHKLSLALNGETALQSPRALTKKAGDLNLQLQGASTVVSAWAQGAKDLVFIGAVGNRLDYVLAAHPSIKRPEDLKGKRVGVSQLGSSTDFIARVAVRRVGLNAEKDVQIVGVGGQGDRWTALQAGQIQATVLQSPTICTSNVRVTVPGWKVTTRLIEL